MDGEDAVAVFAPAKTDSLRNVRACVFVMADEQLVVVSARGNLEPLAELLYQSEPLREFREAPEKWMPKWLSVRGESGDSDAASEAESGSEAWLKN
jgi:hypothetical protein